MQKNGHFYLVRVWFAVNALVATAPPLYWIANSYKSFSILGLPVTLFYFLLIGCSITASILYAYWVESISGELSC